MTIVETAKITSKGQITIPNRIRKMLHLSTGGSVAFGVSKDGIVLVPCTMEAKSPYTPSEWVKIEKMAAAKGKIFKNTSSAKDYLKSL